MMQGRSSLLTISISVAAAVILITLLAFSYQIDQQRHRQLQSRLQGFYQLDAQVNQSLGLLQHGLLAHYDNLTNQTHDVQRLLRQLSPEMARGGGDATEHMRRLHRELKVVWQEKSWLIERFKSDQAVLRNSRRFFPEESMQVMALLEQEKGSVEGFNAGEVKALSRALTQLLRTTLLALGAGIDRDFWEMDASRELVEVLIKDRPGPITQRIQNLLAHAAIIHRFQSRVDRWALGAVQQPTESKLNELADLYYGAFEQDLNKADRLRLWMYLLTVVLLGGGALGLRKLFTLSQAHTQQEALVVQRTTDLRRELRERRKAEERFRSVAESAGDAIVAVDHQGSITFWNRSAKKIFGYSFKEVKGRSLEELLSNRSRKVYQSFVQEGDDGTLLNKPGEVRALDGVKATGQSFPIEVSLASWKNEGQRFFTLVIRDITERVAMERRLRATLESLDAKVEERTFELQEKMEELKQTQDQLVVSEKMASLGRLAGGTAHEINTPIGIAIGAASQSRNTVDAVMAMLEQDEVDEERLVNELQTLDQLSDLINSSMEKAASLIRALRRFTYASSEHGRELFDLVAEIHHQQEDVQSELDKQGITVQLEMPEELLIFSRRDIFKEIIADLFNNTLLHAFPHAEQASREITISVVFNNKVVELSYGDNGIGMEQEVKDQVFEPFFTTRHPDGRYGLGLYFVQTLLQGQLDGQVSCHSIQGEGSQFTMSWPCRQG
uniref:histidine kinase n=1 Tax=Magnetococcus massalia (strain MO-1) TaxID=451514 RepID=A0A1S7LJP1_MAGMO|nr:Putative sensor histidine kinase with a PAS domain, a HisKA doman and a HATPase_c domain [Candidatus Magnetococcus massalia]